MPSFCANEQWSRTCESFQLNQPEGPHRKCTRWLDKYYLGGIILRVYTKNVELIFDKLRRIIAQARELEDAEINFRGELVVSHRDGHLLEVIHHNSHRKVSEIAAIVGITRGALSQNINKLTKKGLINRVRREDNYKEIYLELTELGMAILKEHEKLHETLNHPIIKKLTDMDVEKQKVLIEFLQDIEGLLNYGLEILEHYRKTGKIERGE